MFHEKKSDMTRKAVFLDRDGTIIEDRGHLSSPSQAVFFDDTSSALRRLSDEYLLFIITNQQGIDEGILSPEDVSLVNSHIVDSLRKENIFITDVYVCPHGKNAGCQCRKPSPFFLRKAGNDYNIDLSRSFVIGDHPGDVECAVNASAQGIYVLTGHGRKHRPELASNTVVVEGIAEAVDYIING